MKYTKKYDKAVDLFWTYFSHIMQLDIMHPLVNGFINYDNFNDYIIVVDYLLDGFLDCLVASDLLTSLEKYELNALTFDLFSYETIYAIFEYFIGQVSEDELRGL